MGAMTYRPETSGSRSLGVASGCLLLVVILAGVLVGAYAVHNPNHIQMGAWPPVAELVAVATGFALGYGVHAQQRHADWTLFTFGVGAAAVSLFLLGAVAFVLSFNQL